VTVSGARGAPLRSAADKGRHEPVRTPPPRRGHPVAGRAKRSVSFADLYAIRMRHLRIVSVHRT